MTAICGILRFDGARVAEPDVARILRTMAHRTPDRRRVWCAGPVGLGHGLLRVTREDQFEAQPLRDAAADLTLVASARLDNRPELGGQLGIDAAALRDMPDSEVLLAAYRRWGILCAGYLVGDFAFALWDGRSGTLILGRDHMGQRPVFYHQASGFFAFATEIKGLWAHPDVPRTLNEDRLGATLMGDMSPAPGQTLYDGILGVPGGTVLAVSVDGRVSQTTYWTPHADPAHLNRSEEYYVTAYRAVLGEAVACRLRRTDRAAGLLFSGGFDSAGIAALAGTVVTAQNRKLIAVASTMPADYRGTIRHARRWVDLCARDMPHLDVHHVTREGRNVLTDFERTCHLADGLVGNHHFVESEMLDRLAVCGARLIMGGHGGDYTLNPRGQTALARLLRLGRLRRFVTELRAHLRLSGHSLGRTLTRDLARVLVPAGLLRLWRRARHRGRPAWGASPIVQAFGERLIARGVVDRRNLRRARVPTVRRRQFMARQLARLAAAPGNGLDVFAAARGLSLTRPFHDKRVVELALAIPEDLDVRHGLNRYLARTALKELYPPEFQSRGRENDDQIPDFQRMAKRIESQILTEVARMEQSARLTRLVDFTRIRALLAARGADDHASGWEPETQLALRGFLVARYVEWFSRDNG